MHATSQKHSEEISFWIALWLAIHGGDPGPIESVAAAERLISLVAGALEPARADAVRDALGSKHTGEPMPAARLHRAAARLNVAPAERGAVPADELTCWVTPFGTFCTGPTPRPPLQ